MSYTLHEIQNQPNSWHQTLEQVEKEWNNLSSQIELTSMTHVVFIGCGTSFYLAQSAARLFQQMTGCISIAIPASEIFLADTSVIPRGVPVISFAISRSGTSSEVLLAVEHLRAVHPQVKTVAVTCHSSERLAQLTHVALALDFAAEQSVVMTQSFTSMLLAIQWVAAKLSNRKECLAELGRLPELVNAFLPEAQSFGEMLGQNEKYQQYVFLGLGNYYGLAAEGTLKLKEMTQTACEFYNPLEFRHGPISIVTEETVVVTIAGDLESPHLHRLAGDISKFGGTNAVLKSRQSTIDADIELPLPGTLSDWSRPVLYVPALQHVAFARAVHLGLDPDHPRNLNQVVVL